MRFLKQHANFLKWILAAGLLFWLIWINRAEFGNLAERKLRWNNFVLALLSCGIGVGSTFVRWKLLVSTLGLPFTFRESLRLGAVGLMCNYVGPGSVGGDLVKAVMLAHQYPGRRSMAMATVLYDRLIGLVSLFMVGALAMLLPTDLQFTARLKLVMSLTVGAAIIGTLGMMILQSPLLLKSRLVQRTFTWPGVGHLFHTIWQAATLYVPHPGTIVTCLVISLFGHLAMLGSFYLCAETIRGAAPIPDFVAHLQFIPAAEIFGVVVPTPGGMGALEGAIAEFYETAASHSNPETMRAARADGLLMALTNRVIQMLVAAIGLIYYASARREIQQAAELSEAEETLSPLLDQEGAEETSESDKTQPIAQAS